MKKKSSKGILQAVSLVIVFLFIALVVALNSSSKHNRALAPDSYVQQRSENKVNRKWAVYSHTLPHFEFQYPDSIYKIQEVTKDKILLVTKENYEVISIDIVPNPQKISVQSLLEIENKYVSAEENRKLLESGKGGDNYIGEDLFIGGKHSYRYSLNREGSNPHYVFVPYDNYFIVLSADDDGKWESSTLRPITSSVFFGDTDPTLRSSYSD